MRSVGEKSVLVGDESFDAIGGSVEHTRKLGDFVAALITVISETAGLVGSRFCGNISGAGLSS